MTAADLQRLETAIRRPLSPAVRQFFLSFPPGLRTPDEEREPDDSDFELTDDADDLIRMNTPGWGCIVIPNAGPNVFALGSGGCGETWWVDLDDEHGAVYFCDAGTYVENSDRVADSLSEFAQRMLDAEEED
jgi:hypothetical protein